MAVEKMRKITVGLLLALALVAWPAAAQRPICVDPRIDGTVETRRNIIILDWQQTVCLEHADRVRRLKKLAEHFSPEDRPEFSEFLIDRSELPSMFRTGMPLLRIVFPEHSFFDTARSEIRPEAMSALGLIAESLRREVPDVAVFVAGHTDDRGSTDYNQDLSIARANAVSGMLARMGVGQVALWRIGFGEDVPLYPNDSPNNMARNRRVEFIIGARVEPVATWLAKQREVNRDVEIAPPKCCKVRLPPPRPRIHIAERIEVRTPVSPPAARPSIAVNAPEIGKEKVQIGVKTRLKIDLNARKYRIDGPGEL